MQIQDMDFQGKFLFLNGGAQNIIHIKKWYGLQLLFCYLDLKNLTFNYLCKYKNQLIDYECMYYFYKYMYIIVKLF